MLTSLDFLNQGSAWPPPTELERLALYKANRDLFEGAHEKVFKDWVRLLRDDQKASLEIILNWPKRLSTLFADLLLGEPPQVKAGDEGSPEQEAAARLIEENNLFNAAYEVALDVSRFGVGLFKVRYDGRAIIEAQTPLVWFPVVKPDNVKDVLYHVLAWDYEETEERLIGARQLRRLKVEIHERGRIITRVYDITSGNISAMVGEEQVQETGVDDFLVVPVYNLSTSDRLTGLDDYSDLDSVIQELEIRIAQISRILDKHADPNLVGPDTALEQDPKTGEVTFRGGGKYFPLAPGDQPPQYVTWDGQLDAAFREIELLMEQFYALSETCAAAFGNLKQGLAESGTALRRLMMAPLAKTNRIRMRFDPALKQVLKVASALEAAQGMPNAVKLEDIHITWQDGLPDDDMERTQIEVQRYGAGLTSLESALTRLDGLEGKSLRDEVERIRGEQRSAVSLNPETSRPTVTLPAGE
ncbi:MAG TPA: phage portal protein [Firmicutes bacterium]|nr:phage portal protein [Candidatus Fermentithermobacillaceae bacterium]